MRRYILVFFVIIFVFRVSSQELQLHFDPRHALHSDVAPRNYLTATFQMFKADKWGSTFGFIDMDFSRTRSNIGLAYLEISRNIKIGNSPVVPHIEFNGGVSLGDNASGFSIPNAYLVGPSFLHSFNSNFNIETYLAYKYNAFKKVSNDIQWTASWTAFLLNKKVTLTGFVDVWTENKDKNTGKGGKKVILMSEPQFWYNIDDHLSFGSEIEISNNFYPTYNNRVYFLPTIAGKWTF